MQPTRRGVYTTATAVALTFCGEADALNPRPNNSFLQRIVTGGNGSETQTASANAKAAAKGAVPCECVPDDLKWVRDRIF
jgi:hypothetical protein